MENNIYITEEEAELIKDSLKNVVKKQTDSPAFPTVIARDCWSIQHKLDKVIEEEREKRKKDVEVDNDTVHDKLDKSPKIKKRWFLGYPK